MSAPRVFKGREVEMTEAELAASSTAANFTKNEDEEDDFIPIIKSDIFSSGGGLISDAAVSKNLKRKPVQPVKNSVASKKLKQPVHFEAPVEYPNSDSYSALPSVENQPSSRYSSPDSPSPAPRKANNGGKSAKASVVPVRKVASAVSITSAAPEIPEDESDTEGHGDGNDTDHKSSPGPVKTPQKRGRRRKIRAPVNFENHENDGDVEDNASSELVGIPNRRGRSGKTQMPASAGPAAKGKSKGIRSRASARLSIAYARQQANKPRSTDSGESSSITTKKPIAAKKNPTTHGRGVARVKPTHRRMKSRSPQYTTEEYIVEKIVDSRVDAVTKEHMYMVKWKGYAAKDNTWEPKKNLGKCSSLINAFNKSKKGKKGKA